MSEDIVAQVAGVARAGRSRAAAEQVVREFEASGLSRREFCRQRGLALGTLDLYRKRQRQENGRLDRAIRTEAVERRLLSVELSGEAEASSGVTLVLSGVRRIELGASFDASTLERLLAVLEKA